MAKLRQSTNTKNEETYFKLEDEGKGKLNGTWSKLIGTQALFVLEANHLPIDGQMRLDPC